MQINLWRAARVSGLFQPERGTATSASVSDAHRRLEQPAHAGRSPYLMLALAAATLVILAHGCHGANDDHEPAVALPADDAR